jgi:hypothetical protein
MTALVRTGVYSGVLLRSFQEAHCCIGGIMRYLLDFIAMALFGTLFGCTTPDAIR